ncbi:snRNA-activating protein complex subunit 1b [Xyrichtys novacula]|uniref:snRNA-activating protein complex subunit 1b n=1 Tax=Xyrichtys novacula TaxID=13765 RepID=A0AAV1GKL2_XYRNO|nr:snRNA-activating protein complex subunit 1b [Xyrichtys novacula]
MDTPQKLVKTDCEEILHRFQQQESVRFEIFSKIWREMKFSEIFYGLPAQHEKRKFSRLILDTACSYLLPPYSFQIRVGGLYLLYSLYRCQTFSPPEQIRVALKDWEYVEKFEKDALEAKHLDVVYILHQLMCFKAFHFTAMPTLLTFQKKRQKEKPRLCEGFIERASRPQELINIELLEELSNIHDIYGKLKTSASLMSEDAPTPVNLTHKDLIPKLRSTVVDFYTWQQKRIESDEEDYSGEGTSSQQESSKRAEKLAAIKSRAFGQATEAAKSRRHRQVEVDLTSNQAGPSNSSGHTRLSKPSLKVRTNENLHISSDLWKEATATTKISRLTALDFVPEEKPKKNYRKSNKKVKTAKEST